MIVVYDKIEKRQLSHASLAADFLELVTDVTKILFQSHEDYSDALGSLTSQN